MNRFADIKKITFGGIDNSVRFNAMLPVWLCACDMDYRRIETVVVDNCDTTLEDEYRFEVWAGSDLIGFDGFFHPKGMPSSEGFKWFCNKLIAVTQCYCIDLNEYQFKYMFALFTPDSDYQNVSNIQKHRTALDLWTKLESGHTYNDFDMVCQNYYAVYKMFCFVYGLCNTSLADLYASDEIINWLGKINSGNCDVILID